MVEMFSPATEAERDLLCKIFKVSRTDLVDISPERTQYHTDAVNRLREIFNDETVTSIRRQLHEEGFTICHDEDATYAINFKQHIIINLTEENFNLQRLKEQRMKQIEPTGKSITYIILKHSLIALNHNHFQRLLQYLQTFTDTIGNGKPTGNTVIRIIGHLHKRIFIVISRILHLLSFFLNNIPNHTKLHNLPS